MPACYCDQSARAFRDWLRERYGSLGGLNAAWGTEFWGQTRSHPGSYPGPLGGVLGVTVEEFLPLRTGEQVRLQGADDWADNWADAWAEMVHLAGAETILSYADGPAAGAPAVTRHSLGSGQAWYISTRPAEDLLTGTRYGARLEVPGGEVRVLRQDSGG